MCPSWQVGLWGCQAGLWDSSSRHLSSSLNHQVGCGVWGLELFKLKPRESVLLKTETISDMHVTAKHSHARHLSPWTIQGRDCHKVLPVLQRECVLCTGDVKSGVKVDITSAHTRGRRSWCQSNIRWYPADDYNIRVIRYACRRLPDFNIT